MDYKGKYGFTLIELLVVVSIIGLLSTMAVVSLNEARKKARDAKRIADMKQLQMALELYFNDKNQYPTGTNLQLGVNANAITLSNSDTGFEDTSPSGSEVYMSKIPNNPAPTAFGYDNYLYTAGPYGCDNLSVRCDKYSVSFGLEDINPNLGSSAAPCHASSTGMACP